MPGKRLILSSSLFALSALMLSPSAEAKIPVRAIKNITRHFKRGQEYNSPTFGEAALLSGLIYDLRFYGNIEPRLKNERREYVKDEGRDGVSSLLISLFPSPSGALSIETTTADNFGKYATPASVAALVNFAHQVRHGSSFNDKGISKKCQDIQAMFNLEKLTKSERKSLTTKMNGMLKSIQKSIQEEKEGHYPEYTTEQVITGFFCEKFNTPQDIRDFLDAMDSEIVDRGVAFPQGSDWLEEEDLKGISAKADFDADDVFALLNADAFYLPTPYKAGNQFLSHGNTRPFDRRLYKRQQDKSAENILKEKEVKKVPTFADCAEMAARHVMNLILYDPGTKQFNLDHLRKHIKEDNPYFELFEQFYEAQTFAQANDGNIDMRSLWARVLGDLNTDENPIKINYLKTGSTQSEKYGNYEYEYELNPGYINFIKAFYKIFGLELKALPTRGLDAKKQWLSESLEKLFTTMNPTRNYQFDLSTVREKGDDLSGNIQITVQDSTSDEKIFSFDYYAAVGEHSDVKNLHIPRSGNEVDYAPELKTHLKRVSEAEKGTAKDVLWLLKPELSGPRSPFYDLFAEHLSDNDSRIRALDKVSKRYPEMANNPSLAPILPRILKNILADISWEDKAVLIKASPVISKLMQVKELEAEVISMVKGFYLSQESDLKEPHLQPLLSQVTNLTIDSKISNVEGIEICKGLKHLDLENSVAERLRLDSLSNLEVVNLRNTKSLKELSIHNLSNLKELYLSGSNVERLEGLPTLTNLQKLNLIANKGLKEFSVKGLSNLNDFNLSGSKVERLEGLHTLTNLQNLKLSSNLQLKELSVENLHNLKEFDLMGSNVAELKGLHTVTNLQNLRLSFNRVLKHLSVANLRNLTELNLRYSEVGKLEGLHTLTNLQNLNLSSNKRLKELSFNGLSNLKELNLNDSVVEKLDELNTLTNLQNLNLASNKGLKELSVENLRNLTELNLNDSVVAKVEGLDTLTNLQKLNLRSNKWFKELSFEKFSNLKELDLTGSNAERLKGLHTLSNLQKLNLISTKELKELSVENLSNLRELSLSNSKVERLNGLNSLTKLQNLNLSSNKQLKELSVDNLRNLKELYLTDSVVEKLDGLHTLTNLKRLDLQGARSLKSLEFTTDMKELIIDLRGSGFKKSQIKGLGHLDESKIIE